MLMSNVWKLTAGLALAVGHTNGKIEIYDIEQDSNKRSGKLFGGLQSWGHKARITAIYWTKYILHY